MGCKSCDGKGWICDTTYDRTGANIGCNTCFSTGRSTEDIKTAVWKVFPKKPTPKD